MDLNLIITEMRRKIYRNLYEKHDQKENYNVILLDNLVKGKRIKLNIVIDEILIDDVTGEFLKRLYTKKEIKTKFKKINEYYINYSRFFMIPTLRHIKINKIFQSIADYKADLFYNLNQTDENDDNSNLIYKNIISNRLRDYIENQIMSYETLESNASMKIEDKTKERGYFYDPKKDVFTKSFLFTIENEMEVNKEQSAIKYYSYSYRSNDNYNLYYSSIDNYNNTIEKIIKSIVEPLSNKLNTISSINMSHRNESRVPIVNNFNININTTIQNNPKYKNISIDNKAKSRNIVKDQIKEIITKGKSLISNKQETFKRRSLDKRVCEDKLKMSNLNTIDIDSRNIYSNHYRMSSSISTLYNTSKKKLTTMVKEKVKLKKTITESKMFNTIHIQTQPTGNTPIINKLYVKNIFDKHYISVINQNNKKPLQKKTTVFSNVADKGKKKEKPKYSSVVKL